MKMRKMALNLWSRNRLRKFFVIGVVAFVLLSLITARSLLRLWSDRNQARNSFWSSHKNHQNRSFTSGEPSGVFIWPAPKNLSKGSSAMVLSTNFAIELSSPFKDLEVVQAAIDRYTNLILKHRKRVWPSKGLKVPKFVLDGLYIELESSNQSLYLGVDESYHLQIPDYSNSRKASLKAGTVYGALRGLETFSQICSYDINMRAMMLKSCPWDIFDEPRFSYRGLLIDTSRHYLPLKTIENVIDSMAFAKLNVLHWHAVDEQSFPLEIPSNPKLWKGAYSDAQRYNLDDAKAIVKYAQLRGINVMPEIDVPGHGHSWGYGYPQLWPSESCTMPLDVSKKFTFDVIDGIFSDLSKVFPFELLHIGGDEVNTTCWEVTEHVSDWLSKNNFTAAMGYEYFVLEVQKLAMKHGYIPVNWQEAFENFGPSIQKNTIIQNWWGPQIAPKVVSSGLKCIISEQSSWYLDHREISWETFYKKDPFEGIDNHKQQQLVIGGEVCMWGEKVDAGNIQQRIWPRAAAAAERLWSRSSDMEIKNVARRLTFFRELLNERGISASPLQLEDKDSADGSSVTGWISKLF